MANVYDLDDIHADLQALHTVMQDIEMHLRHIKEMLKHPGEYQEGAGEGQKQPFMCPACHGTGHVMASNPGSMSLLMTSLECQPCKGKRIVWG